MINPISSIQFIQKKPQNTMVHKTFVVLATPKEPYIQSCPRNVVSNKNEMKPFIGGNDTILSAFIVRGSRIPTANSIYLISFRINFDEATKFSS